MKLDTITITKLRTPVGFFSYIVKDHLGWTALAIMFVVIASILLATSSYFFQFIVDAVDVDDKAAALRYGLLYPVAILVVQLLYRASGWAGSQLTTKVSKQATDVIFKYLLKHSHTYYSNRFAGSVTSKIRNVTGALEGIIPDFLWSQLAAAVSFSVTFVMLFFVDVYISIVFVTLLMALALVNSVMAKEKTRISKENAAAGTRLQGGLSDVMSNIATVRLYTQATSEQTKLESLTRYKRETSLMNWRYTEKLLLINVVIIFAFAFLMFWLLTMKWSAGMITNGEFILVLALVSQITGTMVFIGRAVNATARAVGELREGLEDIYIEYEIHDSKEAKTLAVSGGALVWDQVRFAYDRNHIFSNLSLTIPSRQRIGLVGTSGAGKSTFVSLLLRQHELLGGSISIDEQNISQVTQDSLRAAIAVVPQEPALFHRSIRENIAYGNLTATGEAIERVAKLAYAHDFIVSLPDGYNTLVGERGVKLSGGQKQRIAIARAMLKDAPILVLDEATSALDSESEQLIQKALHSLMAGKTVIAIAHRLSTLREMDRIIVIQDGVIIEDGTPETLKNADGLYARLWSHQAGGFIPEE